MSDSEPEGSPDPTPISATGTSLTIVGKVPPTTPGDATIRRSGRERRAPQALYDATPVQTKRKRKAKHNGDSDASSSDDEDDQNRRGDGNSATGSDEDESEEGSEQSEIDDRPKTQKRKRITKVPTVKKATKAPKSLQKPAQKKPRIALNNIDNNRSPKQAKSPKQPKPRSKKKVDNNPNGAQYDLQTLFEILKSGEDTEDLAQAWTVAYKRNNAQAMMHMINFILESCGCQTKVTVYDIEDTDSAADKLEEIQEEFKKEQTVDYPIIARRPEFRHFKQSLISFFTDLIEYWHADNILYNDPALIENLEVWITAMSSSNLRPFRHTSTVVSLAIITAICGIVAGHSSTVSTKTKQLEAEKKASRQNAARIKQFERDITEAQERGETTQNFITDLYETVFVHRYRDVDSKIRVDCIHELGVWIIKLPAMFFEASYLRYLGWVLSDVSAPTRHEVISALTKLFKDRNNVGGLRHFTEKFRPRLVEMVLQDVDSGVRSATIELLSEIRQVGFLEEEDINSIGTLLYDNDAKVRNAAAEFFESNLEEVYKEQIDQEFGGEQAVETALELAGDTDDDDYEGHRLSWIRTKCVINALTAYNDDEQDSASQDGDDVGQAGISGGARQQTRFSLAGLALWKVVPETQDWVQMIKYLLYDHTGTRTTTNDDVFIKIKDFCALSPKEDIILLQILHSAIFSAIVATDVHTKTRIKRKPGTEESEESISRTLVQYLSDLLKKFGPVPDAASTVLRIVQLVKLDVFQELRQDNAYALLLEDINGQFLSHSADSVLREASAALLHARSFDELQEITLQKIAKLQEETIAGLVAVARGKNLATAEIGQKSLQDIENAVKRLEYLASITDCKEVFETSPSAYSISSASTHKTGKRRQGKGKNAVDNEEPETNGDSSSKLPFDILSDILARGATQDDTEDELMLRAIKTLTYYMMWNIEALSTGSDDLEGDDEAQRQTDFEHFFSRYTTLLRRVESIAENRKKVDAVKMMAASALLEITMLGAILAPAAEVRDIHLSRTMPEGTQRQILTIYNSAEKTFGKMTDKNFKTDDEEVDEEMDDDEEEADIVDDLDDSQKLIYEQNLCEMTGKIVLAVLSQIVDENMFRTRLERNKRSIGLNMKETINHLATEDKTARAKGKKPANAKAKPKISPVLVDEASDNDDDDDDEVEEEANENEENEEAHRDELAREESLAREDEEADERRQQDDAAAGASGDDDENMADADD